MNSNVNTPAPVISDVQYRASVLARFTIAVALLLTGLSAGFFATYQYSVTRALAVLPDSVFVSTFQAINATVRSPEFGVIFFGSLPALLLATLFYRNIPRVRNTLILAVIAYITMLTITFSIHIPLNNALAAVDASTGAEQARLAFESRWNEMHLIRTLAVCTSFVLTIAATLLQPPQ